jgi:chromosome segregation ATPase
LADGTAATDELIRRMYEAPPEQFVAARAAAIADARKAGDRDTAKRLAALRKPTVAAWLVNLLALRRPELIDQLVELSSALRTAQRGLQGDQLRELTTQRRQVVSALVAAARQLAVAEDKGLAAKLPLGEVEATLTAALAEPEIAEQVRTGRLIRAATYAGFGEVPRPRLRLITGDDEDAGEEVDEAEQAETSAPRRTKAAEREIAERKRELRRQLTAAQAAESRADRQLEKAEGAERDAGHAVEDIDAELAELERRRTEAQAEVARTKLARRTAERDAAAARRQVGDVQAAIEDLDAENLDG